MMSARCDQVKELLPWLMNGTLRSEETIIALEHVKQCKNCKKELVFLVTIQNQIKEKQELIPSVSFTNELWENILLAEPEIRTNRNSSFYDIRNAFNLALSPFKILKLTFHKMFGTVKWEAKQIYKELEH